MATATEIRAAEVLAEIERRLYVLASQPAPLFTPTVGSLDRSELNQPTECAGNQHTCQPQIYVPSSDRRFELVLKGTGDSVITGYELGPRALAWQNTRLEGFDPELGKVTVHLEPAQINAGTLIPVLADAAFPALNRNNYFFVFGIASFGELISDRPAIVEALIDEVPPTSTYVFRNGPLDLYLRGDSTKSTVAILEAAVTDVAP